MASGEPLRGLPFALEEAEELDSEPDGLRPLSASALRGGRRSWSRASRPDDEDDAVLEFGDTGSTARPAWCACFSSRWDQLLYFLFVSLVVAAVVAGGVALGLLFQQVNTLQSQLDSARHDLEDANRRIDDLWRWVHTLNESAAPTDEVAFFAVGGSECPPGWALAPELSLRVLVGANLSALPHPLDPDPTLAFADDPRDNAPPRMPAPAPLLSPPRQQDQEGEEEQERGEHRRRRRRLDATPTPTPTPSATASATPTAAPTQEPSSSPMPSPTAVPMEAVGLLPCRRLGPHEPWIGDGGPQ